MGNSENITSQHITVLFSIIPNILLILRFPHDVLYKKRSSVIFKMCHKNDSTLRMP